MAADDGHRDRSAYDFASIISPGVGTTVYWGWRAENCQVGRNGAQELISAALEIGGGGE